MLRDVIIDGYNLLHAAGLARQSYGPGDLDRARKRLLLRLTDMIDARHRSSITVVFDAKEPPADLPDQSSFKSLHVRYAQDHAEADDLIEELIRAHSAPKRLLVVSGDQRLQKAARRRGARSITGGQFLDALEEEADITSHGLTGPRPIVTKKMADVAEVFADINVDELRQETEAVERSLPDANATTGSSQPQQAVDPLTNAGLVRPSSVEEPPVRCPVEEVEFWNKRIADLLREEKRAESQ